MPRNIPNYLKQTRTTQRSLAKRLKISQPYLSQIIKGLRTPSLELALEIERLTGVPVRALVPPQEEAAS